MVKLRGAARGEIEGDRIGNEEKRKCLRGAGSKISTWMALENGKKFVMIILD